YGWTLIPVDQMQAFVSAQVYALRSFSIATGQSQDHWGFAWAPRNTAGLSPADFAAQTGAIIDRLAAAIHDSAVPVDPNDPAIGGRPVDAEPAGTVPGGGPAGGPVPLPGTDVGGPEAGRARRGQHPG